MQQPATPKTQKKFGLISTLTRLLLIASASLVNVAPSAMAIELEAGVGALEEGDDRGRGAAILHVGFSNNWMGRAYAWGRTYGPVTESAGILSVGKRGGIFGSKSLSAAIGGSVMAEQTSISYKDYPDENSSYTSTNAGLMLGMRYEIFKSKQMSVSASWDAHLFPAGSAFILMVTGRKQIIGLTAGIVF